MNRILICLLFLPCIPSAQAGMTSIEFEATTGTAASDPFMLPAPGGDLELTLTPTLTLESGRFVGSFADDPSGMIVDGPMTISGVEITGAIDLEFMSTIPVFGFPISVSANLAGPLLVRQKTNATGQLSDGTTYLEEEPGVYDVTAGPLECSDSAFGIFCGLIETGLMLEFPLEEIGAADVPVPFALGAFDDLNEVGESGLSTGFDLMLPVNDENTVGVNVLFSWEEVSRAVVPEPMSGSLVMWAVLAAGLVSLRKR